MVDLYIETIDDTKVFYVVLFGLIATLEATQVVGIVWQKTCSMFVDSTTHHLCHHIYTCVCACSVDEIYKKVCVVWYKRDGSAQAYICIYA